jgi:hypothetical protein
LEADDIDGLDIVFPGQDLVEDVVGGNLVVLDDAPYLELEDLADNGDLLGIGVPDETVQHNLFLDLLPKAIQVEFLVVDFHVEHHNRFSSGLLFLLGGHLGGNLGSSRGAVLSEGVEVLGFLGLLGFLLGSLFSLFLLFLFDLEGLVGFLRELLGSDDGISTGDGEVPGSGVGVGLALLVSETGEHDGDSGGQAVVSDGGGVSNEEALAVEVLFNEPEELVDVGNDLASLDFSALLGDSDCGDS